VDCCTCGCSWCHSPSERALSTSPDSVYVLAARRGSRSARTSRHNQGPIVAWITGCTPAVGPARGAAGSPCQEACGSPGANLRRTTRSPITPSPEVNRNSMPGLAWGDWLAAEQDNEPTIWQQIGLFPSLLPCYRFTFSNRAVMAAITMLLEIKAAQRVPAARGMADTVAGGPEKVRIIFRYVARDNCRMALSVGCSEFGSTKAVHTFTALVGRRRTGRPGCHLALPVRPTL